MKKFLVLLSMVLLISCTKRAELGDFDTEMWKSDAEGCQGERAEMIDDLLKVKPNLLGLYQKKIIRALGQPEKEELYNRSQTYYIYHIDPSEKCDSAASDPRLLRIRFTSLGIANEIDIR